jgi:hypothetical protein
MGVDSGRFELPTNKYPRHEKEKDMRILGLLKADKESEAGTPPGPDLLARMGAFVSDMAQAGVLLSTDGLLPSSKGRRVKLDNGKITVTDGPFAEVRELVASYALFEVKTMDEAVEWCTRFLQVLGKGECELRPIAEFGDIAPELARADAARRA